MDEVWVIEAHEGHGEGAYVMGVYATQDAARRRLEAAPNMRVVETRGEVRGQPVDEQRYPHEWAVVTKYQVER